MKFTFAGVFDVAYFAIGFADSCCSIAVAYLNYQYFYGQYEENNNTNNGISFFHKLLIFSGPALSLIASLASTYSLDSYLTYCGHDISEKLRLQDRTFLASFVDFYDVYGKNNNDKEVPKKHPLDPLGTSVTVIRYVSWYVVAMGVSPIAPIVNYLLTYLACYERKNPTDLYETIVGQRELIWASDRGTGDAFHVQDVKADWKMKMLDTKRRGKTELTNDGSKTKNEKSGQRFFVPFVSHSFISLFSERIYSEYEDGIDFIEHQLDLATTHQFLYASQTWEMILRSIPNILIQAGLLFVSSSEINAKQENADGASFFTTFHLVSCLLSITQITLFFSARVFRATNFVEEYLPNWSFLAFDGLSTCICVIGILQQNGDLTSSFSFGAKMFLAGKIIALASDFVTYSIYGFLLAVNVLFDGRYAHSRREAAFTVVVGTPLWILGLFPLILSRSVMKMFSFLAIAKDQVLHDPIPAATIGADYLAFHRLFDTFLFSTQTPRSVEKSISANKNCHDQVEVDWHSTFKNARLVLLSMAMIPTNQGDCQNRVKNIFSMKLLDLFERCAVYRANVQLEGSKNNNSDNLQLFEPERRAYHFVMMTRLFLWLEQVQDALRLCFGEDDEEERTNNNNNNNNNNTPWFRAGRNSKKGNEVLSLRKSKSQLSKIQALITSTTDDKPFSGQVFGSSSSSCKSGIELSHEFSREYAEINDKLIFKCDHSLQQTAIEKLKMIYNSVLSSFFGASSQDLSPVSVSNCKRFVAPALLMPTIISTLTEIWYLGSLFCEKYNPHQTKNSHHFDLALKWFLLPVVGFCFTTSLLLLPGFLRHFWSNAVECTFFNRLFQRRNSIEEVEEKIAPPSSIASSRKPSHGSTLFKHEILIDTMESYCQIPTMIQVKNICVKKNCGDDASFQKIPEQAIDEHLMPFLHRKFIADDD